jgi:hypothetical protein
MLAPSEQTGCTFEGRLLLRGSDLGEEQQVLAEPLVPDELNVPIDLSYRAQIVAVKI